MSAHYYGNTQLNKHQSLRQIVENMIKGLAEEKPSAEVTGVQIFMDGMWEHKEEVVAHGQKLQVDFVPTSNENMPGWVRLVYGEGVLESATKVNIDTRKGGC